MTGARNASPDVTSLAQVLLDLSQDGKRLLPFSEYMAAVLYHPRFGYYHTHKVFGPEGDYQTAPRVHAIFGWTVAELVISEWERAGKPEEFTILEMGAGEGNLSRGVVEALDRRKIPTSNWRFFLQDIVSKGDLGEWPKGELQPLRVNSLKLAGRFNGVVLANELLDALPFHRFVFSKGEWKEAFVRTGNAEGSYSWELADPSDTKLLLHLPKECEEGTTREVTGGLDQMFRTLSEVLQEGVAVFFDYGDTTEKLLDRFPGGKIETFKRHQVGSDPFEAPGDTDITAWVDFSNVMEAAKVGGFAIEEYCSQAEALYNWGMYKVADGVNGLDPVEEVRMRMAMKTFRFGYTDHKVLKLRRVRRARARRLISRMR